MLSAKKLGLALGAAALCLTVSVASFAQAGAAPAQGQGRGQGRGQGGRGGFGQVTLAQIPLPILESSLKLTGDQKIKVKIVQDKLQADGKELRDAAQAGGDPAAFREVFTKMRELSTKANTEIEGILDDNQKAKVAPLVKDLGTITSVGLPIAAVAELNLTDDQKKKLGVIAADSQKAMQAKRQEITQNGGDQAALGEFFQASRAETKKKALEVLTDDQKKTLKKFPDQPGGPGGFGGGGARRPQP
jgi:hypothetical protein